jgi:hypothetical protein
MTRSPAIFPGEAGLERIKEFYRITASTMQIAQKNNWLE